jgi:multiple sugar transport system permease protein
MTTTSQAPTISQLGQGARPVPHKHKKDWTGWKFVAPFLAVFALVLIAPVIYSVYLSLFKDQLVGGNSFVGIANYSQALSDPKFWDSIGRVSLFLVVQVPIMLALALFAALAIDSARLHLSSFFRIAIFLPYAVPAVVATLMWGFMYGTQFGLVKNLDDLLKVVLPAPLSSPLVLAAIGNIVTWEFVGYNMILFYAALRVIPTDLYEAAELDGAGTFRIIRSIKFPALRPAIVIGIIFSIIGSFQLFNEPSILEPLAPNSISSFFTPNLYAYNLSFSGQQYNYSATIAIIVGVLTALIAYAVQIFGSRKEA